MPPEPPRLPPSRPAEQRALAAAAKVQAQRILCTTVGRAQAAVELATARPAARVVGWFLDRYQQQLAAAALGEPLGNLQFVCQADLPETTIDLAVIPLSKQGEAELARELLQQACQRLEVGGTLVAAVDNPRDQWLREQLEEIFPKVTVEAHADAMVYLARKKAELRKVRNFRCEFTYRDQERVVLALSRPGVFSHRRLDPGARQLLDAVEVTPGMQVLEIGCGAGTVSLALAARDPSIAVHAVDSNARAIECTLAGASLNSLENATTELNCDGDYRGAGGYDLAVANPPYYADNQIAQLFLDAAHRSLRRGGRVLVVAKYAQWYEETMQEAWLNTRHWASKSYCLIEAFRP